MLGEVTGMILRINSFEWKWFDKEHHKSSSHNV